jgi:hypothetical protein
MRIRGKAFSWIPVFLPLLSEQILKMTTDLPVLYTNPLSQPLLFTQ